MQNAKKELPTGEYIEPDGFKGTGKEWFRSRIGEKKFIRYRSSLNGEPLEINICEMNTNLEEYHANADLISQSKELAKALQEAVAYEEEIYEAGKSAADWHNNNSPGVGQGDNQYQSWVPLPEWVTKAREVLQKAIPV